MLLYEKAGNIGILTINRPEALNALNSENSTSIGVRNQDAALAGEVLNEEFSKEIEMGERR